MVYLELFFTFFKIGAFTFGGGYAMLPLIQEEVINHGWLSMTDLINFIAVSESTPGPFAVNISTYVGAETGGIFGAICATFGVVIPSFIIILLVARCYKAFRESAIVNGLMSGLKPAVVGLIGAAVISVGKNAFLPNGLNQQVIVSGSFLFSLMILIIMLIAEYKKCHPIFIILASAILGVLGGYIGII